MGGFRTQRSWPSFSSAAGIATPRSPRPLTGRRAERIRRLPPARGTSTRRHRRNSAFRRVAPGCGGVGGRGNDHRHGRPAGTDPLRAALRREIDSAGSNVRGACRDPQRFHGHGQRPSRRADRLFQLLHCPDKHSRRHSADGAAGAGELGYRSILLTACRLASRPVSLWLASSTRSCCDTCGSPRPSNLSPTSSFITLCRCYS